MSRHQEIFERITELEREEDPFAVATVIIVQGSSSGRVGDKAIYGKNGKRVLGYIGGGCIENRVARTALESFADGNPRIVNIDLDSDEMGMGIPCGGNMAVMVEPHLNIPSLLIRGMGRVVEVLAELGTLLNFKTVVQTQEDEAGRYSEKVDVITEPLDLEDLDLDVNYFVLATHHRDDDKLSLEALKRGIPYVAVIASDKKTGIITNYLTENGVTDEDLERFHAPAGLDLSAKTAEEIALSIMSEMVMHRNGGTGHPMRTTTTTDRKEKEES